MRIRALTIEGFTSYKTKVHVDFSDFSVFVITGPNGAGKSSLVESILFALYGKCPRGERGISPLISQDASEMRVDLEFYVKEDLYKVLRKYKKGKGGKIASPVVELRRREHDKWVLVSSKSKEVTKKITELLGMDYQTFIRAVIIPQNMFDKFLKPESAKERREILITLLGLTIYEKIRNLAKDEKTEIEKKMEKTQGRWEQVKDVTEKFVDDLKRKIEEKDNILSEREKELETIFKEYERVKLLYEKEKEFLKTKEELNLLLREERRYELIKEKIEKAKVVKEFSEKYKYLQRLKKDFKNREELLKKDENRLIENKKRLTSLKEKRKKYLSDYEKKSLEELLLTLEKKRDKFLKVSERLIDIKDAYREFMVLTRDIKKGETILSDEGKKYRDRYLKYKDFALKLKKAKKREIEYYVAKIALRLNDGDKCPVCGGIYRKEKGEEEISFELDIESLSDKTSAFRIEIERMKTGIWSILSSLKEKRRERQKKKELLGKFKENLYNEIGIDITGYKLEDVEILLKGKRSEIEGILNEVKELKEELSKVEEKNLILEERLRETKKIYLETKASLEKEEELFKDILRKKGYESFEQIREFLLPDEDIERLERIYNDYVKKVFALERQVNELSWILKKKGIRERFNSLEEKRREIQKEIKEIASEKATLKERLKKAISDLQDRKNLKEEMEGFQKKLAIYNVILQDLQSDRLPEYILGTVMLTLFDRASKNLEILSYGRYTLELDEKDNIVVIDSWNGGEKRSVDTLSGGEIFATSLALAISLRELVQGRGILDTFFIDEGFGALDKETREKVVEVLGNLSETGKLIGIITHVEELAMNFPVGFRIRKSPEGSRVDMINPAS